MFTSGCWMNLVRTWTTLRPGLTRPWRKWPKLCTCPMVCTTASFYSHLSNHVHSMNAVLNALLSVCCFDILMIFIMLRVSVYGEIYSNCSSLLWHFGKMETQGVQNFEIIAASGDKSVEACPCVWKISQNVFLSSSCTNNLARGVGVSKRSLKENDSEFPDKSCKV